MLLPHNKHSLFSYIFASSVAVALGIVLAFTFTTGVEKILAMVGPVDVGANVVSEGYQTVVDGINLEPVGNWFKDRFAMVRLGSTGGEKYSNMAAFDRAVMVDLEAMTLTLYDEGKAVEVLPIVSKGKPGSPWETPPGTYSVKTKEEKHFSSIGEVWMPYSMQFYGNFFIHGWPYYENGIEVPKGYSGGCIRLATEDAAKVFAFVERGTAVIVNGGKISIDSQSSYYRINPFNLAPEINAKAYLLADLETGDIIAAKNADQILPVASISKLVTALVSLEVINQFQTATVSKEAVETFGEAGDLQSGQSLPTGELIYPLLLESSNDAAEVLARHIGRDNFIKQMNAKAQAIGLVKTKFADPSGISPDNTSDAHDIFALLKYVNQYKKYVFSITKLNERSFKTYRWLNSNEFVGNQYFIGGKNGHTTAAGGTFAGVFTLPLSEFATRTVAVIVLGSNDRKGDVNRALSYLTENIYYANNHLASIVAPPVKVAEAEPKPIKEIKEMVAGISVKSASATTSLVFVGDIMMDRGVRRSVDRNGSGDYDYLFHRAPFLKEADIAFANLEGPVSDQGVDRHNLYSFRMDPKSIEALANAGFDVLSVANNHMGDWGYEAFVDTLNRLTGANIVYTGGGLNQAEAEGVKVIEKNGTKFGFVGFSDVGPNNLAATGDRAGIVIASEESVSRVISAAATRADVVVASFHFGDEYELQPNERQKKLARLAIDSGAKIVVGHHPHVIEPVEQYKGGVIVYSLGNFIFDQYFSEATMIGGVLSVDVFGKEIVRVSTSTVSLNSFFVPELSR